MFMLIPPTRLPQACTKRDLEMIYSHLNDSDVSRLCAKGQKLTVGEAVALVLKDGEGLTERHDPAVIKSDHAAQRIEPTNLTRGTKCQWCSTYPPGEASPWFNV
jgi:hypothetical protein